MALLPGSPTTPTECGRALASSNVHDPVFPNTAEVRAEHAPEAAEDYTAQRIAGDAGAGHEGVGR